MSADCPQNKLLLGPHRGAIRYLFVKNPKRASALAQQYGVSMSELVSGEVFVSEAMIDELWDDMLDCSANDNAVCFSAGRLLQLHDLGERGWLVYHSENIQSALAELQRIKLPFEIVVDKADCLIGIDFPDHLKSDVIRNHYFLFGLILNLIGLCRFPGLVKEINIPWNHSLGFESQRSRWSQLASLELGLKITYGGENLTLIYDREKCLSPLRTSDSALYAFFYNRIVQSQMSKPMNVLIDSESSLIKRIKQCIKSKLSGDKSSAQSIAGELGISVRTLERTLALENQTLRCMKREIQRDTSVELLKMGLRAKEVALQVGFDDVTSFTRAFRQWTGTSPSQIRKQSTHGH